MPDDPIDPIGVGDAAELPVPVETVDAHEYAIADELGKDLVAQASKAEPALTISKWDGEFSLSIGYDLAATADAVSEPGKIAYKDGQVEFHVFPVQNGFEMEAVLLSNPGTNVFEFPVSGTDGLYFYQQPGPGENFFPVPEAHHWTDTEVFNVNGDVIASRPENIIGSIAVYSGKKNGKYGTGKIGHILRPKTIDAKNVENWCTLEFTGTSFRVTAPQSVMDTATYPLKIDPTLGYTTVGGSQAGFTPNFLDTAGPYSATEDGTITASNIYYATICAADITLGAYLDNSGIPDALLGNTAGGTFSGTGWKNRSMSGSFLNGDGIWNTSNTDAVGDTDRPQIMYDVTGGNRFYLAAHTHSSGTLPDPHSSGVPLAIEYSIYIDYTPSGGGTITASANFVAPAAVFAAEATVAVPVVTASAAFVAPAAEFNATASTGAPLAPISASAAFVAPAAVFAAEALVNASPVVDAGPNQTIDLPTLTATMNGTVTDDGNPDPPGAVTATWTKISGPSTVVFTDDNDPDTLVTFGAAGVYWLQLAADDGQLVVTDLVRIWIRDPDAVGSGQPQGLGLGLRLGLLTDSPLYF